jgi:maleylpyruvate isomerase
VTSVARELDQVRESDARLLATVQSLDESALRRPSLLPGWSRAHVLVHLARNADAQVRMIDAALRGASVEQYAGGEEGRARAIEEGVAGEAARIVADLESSVAALAHRWATLPEDGWDLETVTLRFRRPVRAGIAARWREVEIHHGDLGCGYGPADWPVEFVDSFLERTVSRLPGRLPSAGAESGLRWRLIDRDAARSWRVDAESVRDGDGVADADVEVAGSGWQLLAWLVGRGDYGLDVGGQAHRLPDLAPYG